MERIKTYEEFWHYYLQVHSKPSTKRLHALGTCLGLAWAIWSGATGRWLWMPFGFVLGYGFAWFSHFFIEKNRPATFQYPWWSFLSDFKMLGWLFTGRL